MQVLGKLFNKSFHYYKCFFCCGHLQRKSGIDIISYAFNHNWSIKVYVEPMSLPDAVHKHVHDSKDFLTVYTRIGQPRYMDYLTS